MSYRRRRRYRSIQVVGVVDTIHDLNEKIAWRAAELGMTIDQVAWKVGWYQGKSITELANQKRVTAAKLLKICEALGWPDLGPLHEPLPNLEAETKQILKKWKKAIAGEIPGARKPEPTESGRKQ